MVKPTELGDDVFTMGDITFSHNRVSQEDGTEVPLTRDLLASFLAPNQADPSKYLLKTEAATLMLSHFPVRQSTAFGLVREYCLCGLRFNGDFTYPVHVIALLEGDNDDPVGN